MHELKKPNHIVAGLSNLFNPVLSTAFVWTMTVVVFFAAQVAFFYIVAPINDAYLPGPRDFPLISVLLQIAAIALGIVVSANFIDGYMSSKYGPKWGE